MVKTRLCNTAVNIATVIIIFSIISLQLITVKLPASSVARAFNCILAFHRQLLPLRTVSSRLQWASSVTTKSTVWIALVVTTSKHIGGARERQHSNRQDSSSGIARILLFRNQAMCLIMLYGWINRATSHRENACSSVFFRLASGFVCLEPTLFTLKASINCKIDALASMMLRNIRLD